MYWFRHMRIILQAIFPDFHEIADIFRRSKIYISKFVVIFKTYYVWSIWNPNQLMVSSAVNVAKRRRSFKTPGSRLRIICEYTIWLPYMPSKMVPTLYAVSNLGRKIWVKEKYLNFKFSSQIYRESEYFLSKKENI